LAAVVPLQVPEGFKVTMEQTPQFLVHFLQLLHQQKVVVARQAIQAD
jgi:hypothetical protein